MTKTTKTPEQLKVELVFEPMQGLGGGFRQEWISVSAGDFEASLETGAGLGNPLLTFAITKKGKTAYYTADVRPLIRALIEAKR